MIIRQEIITLSEKVGLLVYDDFYPYSVPAHQRLISRLEKFAEAVYQAGYKDGKFDSNSNDNASAESW